MKRFVIQRHTTSADEHWDLMLESDAMLKTFRLELSPEQCLTHPGAAEKIFDHDPKFLTYQGPVNKGKGSIVIADSGEYETLDQNEAGIDLNFHGRILNGNFTLHLNDDGKGTFSRK